jgi:hypothetical protein
MGRGWNVFIWHGKGVPQNFFRKILWLHHFPPASMTESSRPSKSLKSLAFQEVGLGVPYSFKDQKAPEEPTFLIYTNSC